MKKNSKGRELQKRKERRKKKKRGERELRGVWRPNQKLEMKKVRNALEHTP